MHQQAFQGVAHAGPLHLGVEDDLQGLILIRIRVDKGVADALEVLEHRHGGRFGDGAH